MAKSLRVQIADIDAKIEKLQVERVGLEAKLGDEVDTSAVQKGVSITFNYGKAPNVRSLDGLVLGRKDAEPGTKGGDLVKVAVGEGFDAQIVTIYPTAVTKIHAAEEAVAEEQPAQ